MGRILKYRPGQWNVLRAPAATVLLSTSTTEHRFVPQLRGWIWSEGFRLLHLSKSLSPSFSPLRWKEPKAARFGVKIGKHGFVGLGVTSTSSVRLDLVSSALCKVQRAAIAQGDGCGAAATSTHSSENKPCTNVIHRNVQTLVPSYDKNAAS